jgi:hypothetical protein
MGSTTTATNIIIIIRSPTSSSSSRAAAITRCFAMGGDEELELPKLNQPLPDDDAESAACASSSITWKTHSNALGGKPAGRPAIHPASQHRSTHHPAGRVHSLAPPRYFTNITGVRRAWAGRDAPAQTKGARTFEARLLAEVDRHERWRPRLRIGAPCTQCLRHGDLIYERKALTCGAQ